MKRRGTTSIAANPVLIGAVTVFVAVVLVFLAYNANSGLPFVPTYDLKVRVPNAAGLVKGNEVRLGGTRVGTVTQITPQTLPDGEVVADLNLKLQRSIEPLPADTMVMIRPRSALGLKYVQLTRGTSSRSLANGATIPLSQARPIPVELDDFLNIFDAPTRRSSQQNLGSFGNAIAGRGQNLNQAIQDLEPMLDELEPLAKNLSSSRTDLAGFFQGLAQSAGVVAPAAETQGQMFANLNTTFTALAGVARPYIQESITEGPETLTTATEELPKLRPFLSNSALLFTRLQPGVDYFADAAPSLAGIVTKGTPVFKKSPAFNAQLATTLTSVEKFATDPQVLLGVSSLTETTALLKPTLSFVTPAQTVCNYFGIALRNVQEISSEGGTNGNALRTTVLGTPGGTYDPANPTTSPPLSPNNEGVPASAPANGGPEGSDPSNFLHSNPYPYTAAPGQPKTCGAGTEPFEGGKVVIGNPPAPNFTKMPSTAIPEAK